MQRCTECELKRAQKLNNCLRFSGRLLVRLQSALGGRDQAGRESALMAARVEPGTPPTAHPSGTVTFLFSDIEGSTERWERDRDAMRTALARHDALMRKTLEARKGYIFKTMGDEFCVAFSTASDALGAALETQRELAAEDFSEIGGLRVRMALHTGIADERDGDYFGNTVNRTARLLAIGHGGQVLVSGTTAGLLQGEAAPDSSLRELGEHRLKDLARPEQVYQLVAPDLPQTFPALRSLDELPNNLPLQLTSFVGRSDAVAEIKALIAAHRLVTLVGAGGAGKTRCAIQTGAELLDESGDGVCLAELAPISDPSLVASVVAKSLNLQEQPNRPVLDTLVAYLKRKHVVLILDNCEHVLEEARRVVTAILQACPHVRILATSRESLHVTGEQLYRVPSLAVPPAHLPADQSSQYGAVQLFVDRAHSIDKHFVCTDRNAADIVRVCSRLDGIPLAIELAAARVKVLSPKQLAQKLDERFHLLTGGDRSAMPRQQTMRALVDWSYDLLTDDERQMFRKLSVFAGGFTLESAAAVCGTGSMDESGVLDVLTSLVDKSLVQVETVEDGSRYRLLETTRQYAREKLTGGREDIAAANAHAKAFLSLAEELERAYDAAPEHAWTVQAEPEMENWRAALEWSLSSGEDTMLGRRLTGALRWMWVLFAPSEGRRWVRAALSSCDASTPDSVVGKLELADAQLDAVLMQPEPTLQSAQRAWEKLERSGDAAVVEAQRYAGKALVFLGRVAEGEPLLQLSLATAERLGYQKAKAQILGDLATARRFAGDFSEARRLFAQGRNIAIATQDDRAMRALTVRLADLEFHAGDAESAVRLVNDALANARSRIQGQGTAVMLVNLSAYLVALGRYDEARACGQEALTLATDAQFAVLTAFALQHIAAVGILGSRRRADGKNDATAQSARLLGFVDSRLEALTASREYTEQREYDEIMQVLRDGFDESELAALMAEGTDWDEDRAVAEASRQTRRASSYAESPLSIAPSATND